MKRFLLALLLILFVVNTTTVTAWANASLHTDTTQEQSMEDMPCHEEMPQPETQNKHCEGLCLCDHALLSPMFLIKPAQEVYMPTVSVAQFVFVAYELHSISVLPLRRPPKV